jgi:hypothetical protein
MAEAKKVKKVIRQLPDYNGLSGTLFSAKGAAFIGSLRGEDSCNASSPRRDSDRMMGLGFFL